ncbi:MAG: serine/threonine protein kinase [Bradymonadia bacterium]
MPETRQGATLRPGLPPSRQAETPTERRAQDRVIRLRFPRPIALAWARAVTVDEPTTRMRRLAAVTETTARLLAAIAIADILGHETLPPVLRKSEGQLRRPPDGVWHAFAYQAALEAERAATEAGVTPFVPELADWWREAVEGTSRERALNEAIRLRNVFAHGASPDGPVSESRCEKLESLLRETMNSLAWLEGYRIARVESARPDTNGLFSGAVSLYVGSDDVPWSSTASWGGWLPEGALYLLSPDGARALPLAPWLAVAPPRADAPEQLLLWKMLGKNGGVGLGDGRTDDTCWHNDLKASGADKPPTWKTLLHGDEPEIRARFARVDVAPDGHSLAVDGAPDEHIGSLRARYEIGAPIGYGGMAVVYGARDTQLDEGVAIKVLRESLVGDDTTLERFRRESRILNKMRHANVVPLLNVGTLDDGRPYLVTRLAARGSLHDRVGEATSPSQVLAWMNDALAGLDAIHGLGVLHRDIKPSNLLVDEAGRVMIADFGIAVADDGLELTRTLELVGSQAYMAPALLQGHSASEATDRYSLAVTAHELATGTRPGPNGPGIGAPAEVAAWINTLLDATSQRVKAVQTLSSAAAPAPNVPGSPRIRSWRLWLVAAPLALIVGALAAVLGSERMASDAGSGATPAVATSEQADVNAAMNAYREFRAAQQELQRRLLDQELSDDDLEPLTEFWGEGCYPCWWRSGDKSVSWVFRHIYNGNRWHRTDITIDELQHLVTNEHGVWLLSEDRVLDARADHLAWRSHQRVIRMVRNGERWVMRGEVLAQHIGRFRAHFGLSTDVLPTIYAARGPCPTLVDTASQNEWLIPDQPYWGAEEARSLLEELSQPQRGVKPNGEFRHDCSANGTFAWRLPNADELRALIDHRTQSDPSFRAQGHAWTHGSVELGTVNLESPSTLPSNANTRNRLWLVRFCPLGSEWNDEAGACVGGE